MRFFLKPGRTHFVPHCLMSPTFCSSGVPMKSTKLSSTIWSRLHGWNGWVEVCNSPPPESTSAVGGRQKKRRTRRRFFYGQYKNLLLAASGYAAGIYQCRGKWYALWFGVHGGHRNRINRGGWCRSNPMRQPRRLIRAVAGCARSRRRCRACRARLPGCVRRLRTSL